MAEIDHGTETPPLSEVYATKVVFRRPWIKRDTPLGRHRYTLTRNQNPPMEINEYHDERMRCTLLPEGDQNHKRDKPAVSHINTRRSMDLQLQTNKTIRASRSTGTGNNLRANPPPKPYSNFLIRQIADARTVIRPVSTRGKGRHTQPSQQQTSSENIRYHEENSSKKNCLRTNTCQNNRLVRKLRKKMKMNNTQISNTHKEVEHTWETHEQTEKNLCAPTQFTAKKFSSVSIR